MYETMSQKNATIMTLVFGESYMQLDELHTTVQQRVDDVPKWSVQMYSSAYRRRS